MQGNYFNNAINIARNICIKKIKKGDIVVDATMGNGNDTLFLAELIGDIGRIYSFDIQENAVKNTMEKLKNSNIKCEVNLILDGHENINKHVKEKVSLVIFNLGYLPRAEHRVTTKSDTTITAIQKSLEILDAYGLVIIVVYHGHPEGKDEKIAIEEFISNLNQREYNVVQMNFVNQINNPPMLIVIEKR